MHVVCDGPSEPVDLTGPERVFANLPEAAPHADLLAESERWQTMMDEERPERAEACDRARYRVREDDRGDAGYRSSEELAEAERLAMANSMHDGDGSVIGEPVVADGRSFAYGNAYGGEPEFEELMR